MDTSSTTTDENGEYTFSNIKNGAYTIAPHSTKYTFTPLEQDIIVNDKNEINKDFIAEYALPSDMQIVKGGLFVMGSSYREQIEFPPHVVTISTFAIGKYEVTQKRWQELMGNNPSEFIGDSVPVEHVSWYDAVAFCNALSKHEGLDTAYAIRGDSTVCNFTAEGYRLPTEAEWEFACRAGSATDFFVGDQTTSGKADYDDKNLDKIAWYSKNSGGRTHPVGQKQPNNVGLFDTHGNVFEWCWDWRNHYPSEAQTNPIGPSGPDSLQSRICRGGSWFYVPYQTRSAFRLAYSPGSKFNGVGFRVARTVR